MSAHCKFCGDKIFDEDGQSYGSELPNGEWYCYDDGCMADAIEFLSKSFERSVWKKWKEEPPTGGLMLLEWDGSFVKAFFWRKKVQVYWLGEEYILDPEELQERYWMKVPLLPRDQAELDERMKEYEQRLIEKGNL
jgi:hypothetical protein